MLIGSAKMAINEMPGVKIRERRVTSGFMIIQREERLMCLIIQNQTGSVKLIQPLVAIQQGKFLREHEL